MLELRPEVRNFAEWMEKKLVKNDYRGGWIECEDSYLLTMLYDHIEKLKFSLLNGHELDSQEAKEKVYADAADCANICMMLADKFDK